MERRHSIAGALGYLSGLTMLASSAMLIYLLASGYLAGTILPLSEGVAAIAAAAIMLAVSGGFWIYAGSQISYGVPGWSREGAAAFLGSIASGAIAAGVMNAVAGAAITFMSVVGAVLLARDPDRRLHPLRLLAATGFLLLAALPGAAAIVLDISAVRVEDRLEGLLPARDEAVETLISSSFEGQYSFAAGSAGLSYEGLPDYDLLLASSGVSDAYSIGVIERSGTSCLVEGRQSLVPMGGGGFFSISEDSGRGTAWAESGSVRSKNGDTNILLRQSMMPYLPTLRSAAAAGGFPHLGLCSMLDGLSRGVSEVVSEGETHTLILEPRRTELAARVGHVIRAYRGRAESGLPAAMNMILTITRQDTPDLRGVTGVTRQVRVRTQDGRIEHLSTLVEGGGQLSVYDSIGFRPAQAGPTAPPKPVRSSSWQLQALLR